MTAGPGGTLRHYPRQHSNASAYSMAIPSNTYSHQGQSLLVRGASCSLVDIPTYLGPTPSIGIAGKSGVTTTTVPISALAPMPTRPRLQLDLTKKNHSAKEQTSKTKWTIICVGLTLLTMCVTLVGTMLSIGSQYELDKNLARNWDYESRNKTSNGFNQGATILATASKSSGRKSKTSTTMSPLFARLKEISKEDTENIPKNHNKKIIQNAVYRDSDGKTPVGYRGKSLRSFGEPLNSGSAKKKTLIHTGYKKKTSKSV
jgi:hypothetical protein